MGNLLIIDLEVVTKIVKMTYHSMIFVEIDIHTYLIIKGNDRNFYYFLHNIMTNERRVARILGYKIYFLFDGSRGNILFSRNHENDKKEIEIQ